MKIEKLNKTTTKSVRTLTALLTLALAIGASPALEAHSEAMRITECGPPGITQAGSFVLTNNLMTPGAEDCLAIHAEFVTIDLAGFSIIGLGAGAGIFSTGSSPRGITVRNGTISNFTVGVSLRGDSNTVENVRVYSSSEDGISVSGGVVRDNFVQGSSQSGITVITATVTGNTVRRNGGAGIAATMGNVSGNFVIDNGDGIRVLSAGSNVSGNIVFNNNLAVTQPGGQPGAHVGISVGCPSNVTGNTATFNSGGNLLLEGNDCNNSQNVVGQ